MYFYIIRMEGTNYYKYGITEGLKNRMAQYKTHNPFNIKMIYLRRLKTKLAKELEDSLRADDYLKRVNDRWDWIELNSLERKIVINTLELLILTFYLGGAICPLILQNMRVE